MLSTLNNVRTFCYEAVEDECRSQRSESDDMQKAIAMLYEFKAKLDEMHPNCVNMIEHMLQRPRFN